MTIRYTETLAEFEILGDPAPQGSKTRMPNGAMIEGSSTSGRAKHKSWRQAVAETARQVRAAQPYDGDLSLVVEFRFAMPASRPKRVREAGVALKSAMPDTDKLLRTLGDGLTAAGLIRDDARIVHVEATKLEVIGWTGATVKLRRVEWEPFSMTSISVNSILRNVAQ